MGSHKKFRFENRWIKETACVDVTALSWERERGKGNLSQIARCDVDLAISNKDHNRAYTR